MHLVDSSSALVADNKPVRAVVDNLLVSYCPRHTVAHMLGLSTEGLAYRPAAEAVLGRMGLRGWLPVRSVDSLGRT